MRDIARRVERRIGTAHRGRGSRDFLDFFDRRVFIGLLDRHQTAIVDRAGCRLLECAEPAPGFANGQEIRLTTLMGEFSFRVFTDPRFDVLDAGVGVGAYWFTSPGFDSFSGVVLQPGRLDFHAPTLWSTYRLMDRSGMRKNAVTEILRRVAAVPTFRFSVMEFPSGFSPDAFAGTGGHHVQIPGELVKSWSVFLNFEPFLRKAPFVNKTK